MNKRNIMFLAIGGVALIIITAIAYNVYTKIKKSDLEVKNTYQENYSKTKEINDLDSFYNSEVTKEYKLFNGTSKSRSLFYNRSNGS